jgi:hypothetical protein
MGRSSGRPKNKQISMYQRTYTRGMYGNKSFEFIVMPTIRGDKHVCSLLHLAYSRSDP